jgi:hypothetical protein
MLIIVVTKYNLNLKYTLWVIVSLLLSWLGIDIVLKVCHFFCKIS